jgi:23S rRNA (uracil747-C5)-methyltransferase
VDRSADLSGPDLSGGPLRCDHFDAWRCRSCSLLDTPYAAQLAGKQAAVEALLPPLPWLPPVASAQAGFRNKAKMVVAGAVGSPTLGILGPSGEGVDLRDCALHTPGIVAALPELAGFVTRADLSPYDVKQRRGELKHLLVTESPDGELMVRFVLRSQEPVARIRKHLPSLLSALAKVRVVSVNLQPEHKAILEGEQEILLAGDPTLTMGVNGFALHLRPQGFFQTNTAMAAALYAQAQEWIEEVDPGAVLDLYCGVGGFALHAAGPPARARHVLGVEISAEAIAGARLTAQEAGLPGVRFEAGDAGDAESWLASLGASGASRAAAGETLVIVNPPRRGIGPALAAWLESAPVDHVVYSSCNATTLARDLTAMPSLRPVAGRLLDMFPNTDHYEVLLRLERVPR